MENDKIPPDQPQQPGRFQQHPPPHQPPPTMAPGYGYPQVAYPEESQAVLSLVLSIVGIVTCGGLLCPLGWYFAKKEIDGIEAGRRDPTKRDMAKAGQIIGIIGTLILVGFILFVGFFVALAIFGAAAEVNGAGVLG